jgi:sRNA-binding protein
MNNHYNRQAIESAIELLVESYPKCFFLDPEKRRPLKHNIGVDLTKDGVALAPELVRAAIGWYESHFGYQLALQPGVKRIDLRGKEVGTVTELEHRKAQKYVHERKQEQRERMQEERERRDANLIVEKVATLSNLPITRPMPIPKETPMSVKAVKPNDPLTQLSELSEAVRNMQAQPEPLRPFLIAGLRVVIAEIEKTISTMEEKHE